ncbi:hypothetical protein C4Q28_03140 [Pseudomonas sp. SWI6]|uniref:hypothetical protein n=1 Tax=Pseudomonas sp. SWI6 TaxID=2083051 RepID=UPI000CE5DE62|nr:hypothetical protein [Pseudomonas sp. SWI6]AVD81228.1 hypothetical protein C4Q28_03140 [Pseudomonas sp. SWI6]
MNWSPVKMRWPTQATQWMSQLEDAQQMAGSELASTGARLLGLQDIANTSPGPVGAAAQGVIEAGRQALAEQLNDPPACLVVTPFQSGIGQGRGYQRFLSAPNLLQALVSKLTDSTDPGRPQGELYALCVLFLATRYDHLSANLARFNALMPVPELVRAERRAGHLAKLESEKWEMPQAGPLPRWQALPLERCTVVKAAQQSMAGQIAVLEGYAADSSPMADLVGLATRKASQQLDRNQALADLRQLLEDSAGDTSIRARMVGPGGVADLRHALLEGENPGHEWVTCAGVLLVGSKTGLSFVQELVGL